MNETISSKNGDMVTANYNGSSKPQYFFSWKMTEKEFKKRKIIKNRQQYSFPLKKQIYCRSEQPFQQQKRSQMFFSAERIIPSGRERSRRWNSKSPRKWSESKAIICLSRRNTSSRAYALSLRTVVAVVEWTVSVAGRFVSVVALSFSFFILRELWLLCFFFVAVVVVFCCFHLFLLFLLPLFR